MEFKFQNVRQFLAGLVGSPNLSEKMATDLDSAIKADEQKAGEILASTGGQVNTATTPPAGTGTTTIEAVVITPPAGAGKTTPTVVASAGTEVPQTLEGIMAMVQGLQAQVSGFQTQKVALEQENKELREFKASQSPTNFAIQSENNGAAGTARVSKTAEKDAKHLAELNRLAEQYPSLMSDIIE